MMKMAQITTTEFAAELGTDSRTARKFLRAITPKDEQPGKGSRWAIEGNKRSLGQMKKRFADWTAANAKPEPEAEVATDETPAEEPTDEVEPTDEELEALEVE